MDANILSREQEYDLFRRYKTTGDAGAYEELIRCNQGLVMSIAQNYIRAGADFDDLVSEGNIGLMKAIARFDHEKGFKFSTYAVWWINQAESRYLKNETRTIRIPIHAQEKLSDIYKFTAKYVDEHGTEPTYEEIGEATGMSEDEVKFYVTASERPSSLQNTVGEDGTEVMEFIPSSDPDLQEVSENKDRDRRIREAVRKYLTEKERFVISNRFGLSGSERHTLKEVGSMMGLTNERVRQIEQKALMKLRRRMESEEAA